MAFNMRRAPAASADWNSLYFHQKFMHLVDHGSDWVFGKVVYAGVAVCAAMVVSTLLLGQEDAVPGLASLVGGVLNPTLEPPMFGIPTGGPPQRGESGEEDDDELDLEGEE